jgi:hypothetical protein
MLSLFLVGSGAQLWLIRRFGIPLPFGDQWEEARVVYFPYSEGRRSLAVLFALSKEHRMFFNLVLRLGTSRPKKSAPCCAPNLTAPGGPLPGASAPTSKLAPMAAFPSALISSARKPL